LVIALVGAADKDKEIKKKEKTETAKTNSLLKTADKQNMGLSPNWVNGRIKQRGLLALPSPPFSAFPI
jgi:hypothetical protein